MVGEAVEKRRRHLGVAEDGGPFAEAEIGGDDDAGALVELAEEMEQQGAARSTERQVAELVEDDEIDMAETSCDLAGLSLSFFLFKSIDQLDGGEEAGTLLVMFDGLHAKCGGDVGLAGPRRSRDMLPGIRGSRGGFSIGSILGTASAFR